MNTESIVYPGYIMGKQLKEVWSEGLTRIEVSFYASSCQIEKQFFDRCFIPNARDVIDSMLFNLNINGECYSKVDTGKLLEAFIDKAKSKQLFI